MISLYRGGAIPIAPPSKSIVKFIAGENGGNCNVNFSTWEVWVEVLALLHVHPGGGVAVSVQEMVDVILASVPWVFVGV